MLDALRASKDPALFAIVLEDVAAMAGLLVALIGVFAADRLGIIEADGVASIVIGLILAAVAAFMSIEIKSLIVGEAASRSVRSGLRRIIAAETGPAGPIKTVNEIRTMHMGPEDVLVAASADFHDRETATSIENTTTRIERAIKAQYPEVTRFFLEVQGADAHGRLAHSAERIHDNEEALLPGDPSPAAPAGLLERAVGPAPRETTSRKARKRGKKNKGGRR